MVKFPNLLRKMSVARTVKVEAIVNIHTKLSKGWARVKKEMVSFGIPVAKINSFTNMGER